MSWDSLTQTLNVVGSTRKDVGVDDDDNDAIVGDDDESSAIAGKVGRTSSRAVVNFPVLALHRFSSHFHPDNIFSNLLASKFSSNVHCPGI